MSYVHLFLDLKQMRVYEWAQKLVGKPGQELLSAYMERVERLYNNPYLPTKCPLRYCWRCGHGDHLHFQCERAVHLTKREKAILRRYEVATCPSLTDAVKEDFAIQMEHQEHLCFLILYLQRYLECNVPLPPLDRVPEPVFTVKSIQENPLPPKHPELVKCIKYLSPELCFDEWSIFGYVHHLKEAHHIKFMECEENTCYTNLAKIMDRFPINNGRYGVHAVIVHLKGLDRKFAVCMYDFGYFLRFFPVALFPLEGRQYRFKITHIGNSYQIEGIVYPAGSTKADKSNGFFQIDKKYRVVRPGCVDIIRIEINLMPRTDAIGDVEGGWELEDNENKTMHLAPIEENVDFFIFE